uniref:Autophagy-related protein n=1 Tax=Noctiluca scintillans TaxID=2966 RepID=A0A7S0ZXV1_NOCSC|mmetsp:Transcript_23631/g.62272  ORF Transcript_23631/g.62272 Transcript_23631/m.62272 type:complete len:642 (+) Transcript_23631:70-1995(+)
MALHVQDWTDDEESTGSLNCMESSRSKRNCTGTLPVICTKSPDSPLVPISQTKFLVKEESHSSELRDTIEKLLGQPVSLWIRDAPVCAEGIMATVFKTHHADDGVLHLHYTGRGSACTVVKKILAKYPDRVPVICIRADTLPEISQRKFLVPRDSACAELVASVQKHIELAGSTDRVALYLGVGIVALGTALTMSTLYDRHKSEDGFLHLFYGRAQAAELESSKPNRKLPEPGYVAVICERAHDSAMPDTRLKLKVPNTMLCDEFRDVVRRHLNQRAANNVCNSDYLLSVSGQPVRGSEPISLVHGQYKEPDGVLHVSYSEGGFWDEPERLLATTESSVEVQVSTTEALSIGISTLAGVDAAVACARGGDSPDAGFPGAVASSGHGCSTNGGDRSVSGSNNNHSNHVSHSDCCDNSLNFSELERSVRQVAVTDSAGEAAAGEEITPSGGMMYLPAGDPDEILDLSEASTRPMLVVSDDAEAEDVIEELGASAVDFGDVGAPGWGVFPSPRHSERADLGHFDPLGLTVPEPVASPARSTPTIPCPDRVPIICKRAPRSCLPAIARSKFLVPSDMTCSEFKYIIHRHLVEAAGRGLVADMTIFLFVGTTSPKGGSTMSELFERHRSLDGLLNVQYAAENTLGL